MQGKSCNARVRNMVGRKALARIGKKLSPWTTLSVVLRGALAYEPPGRVSPRLERIIEIIQAVCREQQVPPCCPRVAVPPGSLHVFRGESKLLITQTSISSENTTDYLTPLGGVE